MTVLACAEPKNTGVCGIFTAVAVLSLVLFQPAVVFYILPTANPLLPSPIPAGFTDEALGDGFNVCPPSHTHQWPFMLTALRKANLVPSLSLFLTLDHS